MPLNLSLNIFQEIGKLLFADARDCQLFKRIYHRRILRVVTFADHLAGVWLAAPAVLAAGVVVLYRGHCFEI